MEPACSVKRHQRSQGVTVKERDEDGEASRKPTIPRAGS